jgi:uncharacterized protein
MFDATCPLCAFCLRIDCCPRIARRGKTGKSPVMKIRPVAALLTAIALLSCNTAPARAPAAKPRATHPGLWKVYDADTTIYLFGTIHLLPKNFGWQTRAFDQAANKASELVLEVGDLEDQAKVSESFMAQAVSQKPVPVLGRVAPSKRAAFAAMVAKTGIPLATLDKFDTWAVAITISATMLQSMKLSAADGVERILSTRFRAAKKPVSGLETAREQFGYFDALPEAAQRTFLTSLVDEQATMDTEFAKMIGAWSRGDDKAIALSFDDELRLSPELTEVLLRKRNANWAAWVAKRLEKPGTLMIAVGAGHLAGPESVQARLRAKGFKVVRVQ